MNAVYWTRIPASAIRSSIMDRFRNTVPTSSNDIPRPVIVAQSVERVSKVQATRPAAPGIANMVNAICQSITVASGADVPTDKAIPELGLLW